MMKGVKQMVKVIKKQSKQTYENKEGKKVHYYNYFLQAENGKRIQIKPAFKDDAKALDVLAEYESSSDK